LFTSIRPSATLEDRLIQSLRTSRARRFGLPLQILSAAAAVLLVGTIGAVTIYLMEENSVLPMSQAEPSLKPRRPTGYRESEMLDRHVSSAQELAEATRKEALRHLENEDIGNNPDVPTNYNVPRAEDISVPGPVAPGEAAGDRAKSQKYETSGIG